ncbi:MAG: hypothetical protein LN417_06205, partial [Candidatus Thermoplasmatota archaeon]|nr:hypothetical protein [Candidatus Thermoplasmatota archaeon]
CASILIVLLVASAAGTVSAHRIYVDVTSQEVEIEAYYGDGTPVRNADVTVYLPNGDVYLTNKTDDDGRFTFEVKNVDAEYLIIEVEQTGHKAEVTLGTGVGSSVEEVPSYQAAIAGLGYLLGLAGIATLYATWRLKKKEGADEA